MASRERSARAEIRGVDRLKKSDRELLLRRGHEARERLEYRAKQEEADMRQQAERIRESERYCRSRDEHTRTMDARDRVAAQVARSTGMSHSEAQSVVAASMERSRRAR